MDLIWYIKNKPAQLLGPALENPSLCSTTGPKQGGKVRIDDVARRGQETKMCGIACDYVYVDALSGLLHIRGMSVWYVGS